MTNKIIINKINIYIYLLFVNYLIIFKRKHLRIKQLLRIYFLLIKSQLIDQKCL